MSKLTIDFLYELFHVMVRNKRFFELINDYMKFEYLPSVEWKILFKAMRAHYKLNNDVPSIGILSEQFKHEVKVLVLLGEIKSKAASHKDVLLEQFSSFIQQSKFMLLYNEIGQFWQDGDREKAIDKLRKAKDIYDFSLKSNTYTQIFGQFEERIKEREVLRTIKGEAKIKIPTGIQQLDRSLYGGIDKSDTLLFTAQSGKGKTKFLRWLGVNAAALGFKVIHVQAEGTKEECESGYDATWTAMTMNAIRHKSLDDETKKHLKKRLNNIKIHGGEIYVEAYEEFGKATMTDVRILIDRVMRKYGDVDLVILDYLEKFAPSGNYNWKPGEERARREQLGDEFKDICVEFNIAGATATQASTVAPVQLNNPNFVMTRYNISEFKAIVNPFSYHITYNQTNDEYENNTARLYIDKYRNYKAGQVFRIMQNYDTDQFYDRQKTLKFILQKNNK